MTSFSDALGLLLKHTPSLGVERCRIEQATGRVLRGDIRADRPFPPFDRVMMDGYAIRSIDLRIRRVFHVTGSAPAGQPMAALSEEPFACVEVMTGAPLPAGADCIVPVEEISRTGADEVTVADPFEFADGRFIHRAGSDAGEGTVLLGAGCLLGSREIGVAASCGAVWLDVSRLPKIAVIATGDELVPVEAMPAAHQLRQSNAHSIACALQRAGYPVDRQITLGDDMPSAEAALREQLADSEWLVLTGAVSMGARDFVPGMLDSLGCKRIFHGVAQRPGKPAGCWVGPSGQMVMALPGNPVSALTGLHAFVLPALAVASGRALPPPRLVIPEDRISGLPGMTNHLPVILGVDGRVKPAPTGNSGDFIGLLESDGFITVPARDDRAVAFPFTPWL